jgi:hypothetical protein
MPRQKDFSKHEIKIYESEEIKKYELFIPGTSSYGIRFINTDGILAVTGDYYNWIFCQEFDPRLEREVSDYYWAQKLRLMSEQQSHEFSPDKTEEALKEAISEIEEGWDGDEAEELKEYYERCINNMCSSGEEYQNYALLWRPNFLDPSQIIYEKEIKWALQCVFDAFDEIINRLKK